LISA
jgi:hypothetical protein